jgi:hypothetical protein
VNHDACVSDLSDAIERSRQAVEPALLRARSELQTLERRRNELLREIEQAEAIVGGSQIEQSQKRGELTLHAALLRVLEERGNEPMTARELADEVTRRGLYRKRDGSAVEVNQIHARVANYQDLFEKNGSAIRLREGASVVTTQTGDIVMFKDDDEGFFDWQDNHEDGFFINTERKPNPNYLVLHLTRCPHFKGGESLHWTKDYVKVCSGDRAALAEWARDAVGGEPTLCGTCFG